MQLVAKCEAYEEVSRGEGDEQLSFRRWTNGVTYDVSGAEGRSRCTTEGTDTYRGSHHVEHAAGNCLMRAVFLARNAQQLAAVVLRDGTELDGTNPQLIREKLRGAFFDRLQRLKAKGHPTDASDTTLDPIQRLIDSLQDGKYPYEDVCLLLAPLLQTHINVLSGKPLWGSLMVQRFEAVGKGDGHHDGFAMQQMCNQQTESTMEGP